jgi:hypothetical protein
MTTAFKNASLAVTASYSDVYTCPSETTAIVLLCQCANTDNAFPYDVSVQWLDASNSNLATNLATGIAVPAKSALGCIDGKLVLEAGDKLQALASYTGKLALTVSVLEIS